MGARITRHRTEWNEMTDTKEIRNEMLFSIEAFELRQGAWNIKSISFLISFVYRSFVSTHLKEYCTSSPERIPERLIFDYPFREHFRAVILFFQVSGYE